MYCKYWRGWRGRKRKPFISICLSSYFIEHRLSDCNSRKVPSSLLANAGQEAQIARKYFGHMYPLPLNLGKTGHNLPNYFKQEMDGDQ